MFVVWSLLFGVMCLFWCLVFGFCLGGCFMLNVQWLTLSDGCLLFVAYRLLLFVLFVAFVACFGLGGRCL